MARILLFQKIEDPLSLNAGEEFLARVVEGWLDRHPGYDIDAVIDCLRDAGCGRDLTRSIALGDRKTISDISGRPMRRRHLADEFCQAVFGMDAEAPERALTK